MSLIPSAFSKPEVTVRIIHGYIKIANDQFGIRKGHSYVYIHVLIMLITWLNFTRPPPMSQNKKTEYSGKFQKTGIFHFLAVLVCPMHFFWNIPKCLISQIFGNWYVPKLKMEYPNIPSYSKKMKLGMSQIFFGISHIPK